MGRPVKTYEREMRLIRSMKHGTAWMFHLPHPKGFISKVYKMINNEGFSPWVHITLNSSGVIIWKDPIPKIPTQKDYDNAKD